MSETARVQVVPFVHRPAELSRIRIEATGPNGELVDELLRLTMATTIPRGDGWEIEDHQILPNPTKGRCWGRMTMRKAADG